MRTYALTTRPGSPGYLFATRDDGQLFEIYTQYGAITPAIEEADERAALLAQAIAYWSAPQAPTAPNAPRDTSHDIPDVRAQLHAAGFGEAAERAALAEERTHQRATIMLDRIPLFRLTMPRLMRMELPADAEAYRMRTDVVAEAIYSPSTRNLVVDWGNSAEGDPLVRLASGATALDALAKVFPAQAVTKGHWTLP